MKRPVWIGQRVALALHDESLAAHGGAAGIRDEGLLESALNRPLHHFAYTEGPDIFELASVYTSGILRNHPFVDGNKRTAFLVGVVFLELNGRHFEALEQDATQAVLALAARHIDDVQYAAFLRANTRHAQKPSR